MSSTTTSTITANGVTKQETNKVTGIKPLNDEEPDLPLVWTSIMFQIVIHGCALYGLYLTFTNAKLLTILWGVLMYVCGILGITAGAHRLWSHRSFKATWQLRLLLIIFNGVAYQHSALTWARDHRVHHKYSDTDADPYNIQRGFFFSHYGWLLRRKHPCVKEQGRKIDISDLTADPLLTFQKKYYFWMQIPLAFIMPSVVPLIWGEALGTAFFINTLRYVISINAIFLINSVGHWEGLRPYDKSIRPIENLSVSILNLGECWHNFHHAFPWDYKAGELGGYSTNFTASFIEFMAKIGWAYDLKYASEDIIKKRVQRTGDGTHSVWGWGDIDQNKDEKTQVVIINKKTE